MTEPRIVVLIPAYNEAGSIGATIDAILNQTRPADQVIIIPNGCTDATAQIARTYPVTVLELPRLEHRKSEALNTAWQLHGRDADIVICHDADTVLPPTAIEEWEHEFNTVPLFGGSTSKFTVQQPGFLGRLQKAEYASNIQMGLDRGWTNVLAGAGAAFSGEILREVAAREDRVGPWSYESAVEDYELTYRIREIGFRTIVSPTVRAYTDGMSTVPALWNQRMKWQTGTLQDLIRFGWNPLTRGDWLAQSKAVLIPAVRVLWVAVMVLAVALDSLTFAWWGWLVPLLYVAINIKSTLRVPHRDWKDMVMAVTILPMEFLQCIQGGWILASWVEVSRQKITHTKRDLWAAQYAAEGV